MEAPRRVFSNGLGDETEQDTKKTHGTHRRIVCVDPFLNEIDVGNPMDLQPGGEVLVASGGASDVPGGAEESTPTAVEAQPGSLWLPLTTFQCLLVQAQSDSRGEHSKRSAVFGCFWHAFGVPGPFGP